MQRLITIFWNNNEKDVLVNCYCCYYCYHQHYLKGLKTFLFKIIWCQLGWFKSKRLWTGQGEDRLQPISNFPYNLMHFHCSPLPKRIAQHRYVTPHLNMLGGDLLHRHAMECSSVELHRCAVTEVLAPLPLLHYSMATPTPQPQCHLKPEAKLMMHESCNVTCRHFVS